MLGLSVNLTTLFLGRLRPRKQYFVHILSPVIRAFSDFKAFLYILIGGLSVRGCYHIKTPNFPLPCGRGPTSLPSWIENTVYLAKTLYVPPYLACWNINLSTGVKIQIKFSDMKFWRQFNFYRIYIIAICLLTSRLLTIQRVRSRCRDEYCPVRFSALVANHWDFPVIEYKLRYCLHLFPPHINLAVNYIPRSSWKCGFALLDVISARKWRRLIY